MTCEYWDHGVPPGMAVLNQYATRRAVLDSDLALLTAYHQEGGTNVSHALEYAAKLGRHAITQHLLNIGVPVTRYAIKDAAQRRGPGVDLLLSGLKGEHLERARSAAVTFRLTYGDFDKAFEMLAAGAKPERYYISGAYSGSRRLPDHPSAFHEALDKMLLSISKEELAESTLFLLIEHGRPIHIERALDVLNRPLPALLPHVASIAQGIARLRDFGFRMDLSAFEICAREMPFDARNNPKPYLKRICGLALEDDCEGLISFDHAQPMIVAYMEKTAPFLTLEITAGSNQHEELSEILSLLARCLAPQERTRLHAFIDTWNADKSGLLVLKDRAIADLHRLIDVAIGEQFDLTLECTP